MGTLGLVQNSAEVPMGVRPKRLRNIRLKGEENIRLKVEQGNGRRAGGINHFSAEG